MTYYPLEKYTMAVRILAGEGPIKKRLQDATWEAGMAGPWSWGPASALYERHEELMSRCNARAGRAGSIAATTNAMDEVAMAEVTDAFVHLLADIAEHAALGRVAIAR